MTVHADPGHLAGSALDERFMSVALTLGRRGLGATWPNPAVGAVLVRYDMSGAPAIVGRGWTQPGGRPHAETEALRRAGSLAAGATLYVTLEPCAHHGRTPPCADAIIAAGVRRVVSATDDPDFRVAGQGHARLRAQGIDVHVGIGAKEARHDHAGHIRRVLDRRPHVCLKLAVSSNGKAALAGNRPTQITGEMARRRVHLLRAQFDSILVGIGTALADNPQLTCRLPGLDRRSPVRVVLDTGLRLSPSSRLAKSARKVPTWVFSGPHAAEPARKTLLDSYLDVIEVPNPGEEGLDLRRILSELGTRGITRLLVEGGPTIAAAWLDADLVDEIMLFQSSRALPEDGVDAVRGRTVADILGHARFEPLTTEQFDEDRLHHLWRR